jgi:hypothetical protein
MHIRIRRAQGTGVGAIIASLNSLSRFWESLCQCLLLVQVLHGWLGQNAPDDQGPARVSLCGVASLRHSHPVDALGRSLPIAGERGVPAPRADRYVGMFYFLWHNDPRGKPLPDHGRNDLVMLTVARDANNVYFHART